MHRYFLLSFSLFTSAFSSLTQADEKEDTLKLEAIIKQTSSDPQYISHVVETIQVMTSKNFSESQEVANSYVRIKNKKVQELKKNTVAVAVVIDVSPSMDAAPRDGRDPKINSAMKSANEIISELKKLKKEHPDKEFVLGFYAFSDDADFRTMSPMQRLETYTTIRPVNTGSGTAIGNALEKAKLELSQTKAEKQNIIIVTDGENNQGVLPENVIRAFNVLPVDEFPIVHFVAFDIEASVFRKLDPYLKKIYEAGNQQQLKTFLEEIVKTGILAEDPKL
jgi:uncharacterized protein with von Willebrand factor type A (vWA) domain